MHLHKLDIILSNFWGALHNGHPALLSLICETHNTNTKYWENDLTKTLRLYDVKEKSTFFQLCVLTLVLDKVSDNIINSFDSVYIENFTSSNILEKGGEFYYIQSWYLAVIRMQKHQLEFEKSLKLLEDSTLLDAVQYIKAKILVMKDINDIYNKMKELYESRNYSEIIDYNDKLSLDLNYDTDKHKEIILIVLQTFLKLGEYNRFNYMQNKYSKKAFITKDISDDDYLFNFILADYYHLTSQYETSNAIFETLRDNTLIGMLQRNNINFYIAHNYRHQGLFSPALELFNEVIEKLPKEDVFHIRAVTAIISIKYFMGDYRDAVKWTDALTKMLHENDDVNYNIYRHIANVKKRFENNLDGAIELLKNQIVELESKNLRLIQDYYFELGECFREKANNDSAYIELSHTYYNKAFIFSELNHDKNLKIATQIGKLLLNFVEDKNIKKLKEKLESLHDEATFSFIFDKCINTLLSIIHNTDFIKNDLENSKYGHYLEVLKKHDINLMLITVM